MIGQTRLSALSERLRSLLTEEIILTLPDTGIKVRFRPAMLAPPPTEVTAPQHRAVVIANVPPAKKAKRVIDDPSWLDNQENLRGLADAELDWLEGRVSAIEVELKKYFIDLVISVTPDVGLTALDGKTINEIRQRSLNTFLRQCAQLLDASMKKRPLPPGVITDFEYHLPPNTSITFHLKRTSGLDTPASGLDTPAEIAAFYRALPTSFLPWLQSVLTYLDGK